VIAIPFQAAIDIESATIDVSLRHVIYVSFDLAFEIVICLDLPNCCSDFTSLAGVDEDYQSLTISQSGDKEFTKRVFKDTVQTQKSGDWQSALAGAVTLLWDDSFYFQLDNGTVSGAKNMRPNVDPSYETYVDGEDFVEDEKKSNAVRLQAFAFAAFSMMVLAFGMVILA